MNDFQKYVSQNKDRAKGNTQYEVDVPENYLNSSAEMIFKKRRYYNKK